MNVEASDPGQTKEFKKLKSHSSSKPLNAITVTSMRQYNIRKGFFLKEVGTYFIEIPFLRFEIGVVLFMVSSISQEHLHTAWRTRKSH